MKTITAAQLLSRASALILFLGMVSLTKAEYLRQSDEQLAALPEDNLQLAVKRPFCNAFTGCGRKRSEPLVGSELIGSNGGGGGGGDEGDGDGGDDRSSESDAVQMPVDAFYRNLGQRIMRMRSVPIHPWNFRYSQQNQIRTPWYGYMSDRKKDGGHVI